MKTIKFLFLFVAFIYSTNNYAQVGIGTNDPHPSAALDVESTEKGFLMPRMSTVDRDNIESPAAGLMVYNTDSNKPNYFNGLNWIEVTGAIVGGATEPDAPTGLFATAGDGEASLEFNAPANNGGAPITNYIVTTDPAGGSGSGNASPITVTGLTNGTSYTFTLVAVNAVGSSVASAPSNAVTPVGAPDAPTDVVAAYTQGETSALISFEIPANNGGAPITGYTVTSNPGGLTGTGNASGITVSGLSYNTTYTFTVVANNGANSAASAASNSITVLPNAPSAPLSVSATSTASGQATVTFDIPTSDGGGAITNYVVTSIPAGGTGSGSTSSITVTGLTNGTEYTFTVVAQNTGGDSPASAASNAVTPVAVPSAPRFVEFQPGNGQVIVSWTAPVETATTYAVEHKQSGSPTWTVVNTSNLTATLSGLSNTIPRQIRLRATNASGTSAYTQEFTAQPVAGTVLLYEDFNQDYTTTNWLEQDQYSALGASPAGGVISRDVASGRLRINPSAQGSGDGTLNKSFIKTAQTFDRSTSTIEIQYYITYDAVNSYSPNGQGYGAIQTGNGTLPRYTINQYNSSVYQVLPANALAGVNADLIYYGPNTNTNHFRMILPAGGGMQIWLNGNLLFNKDATFMPAQVNNYPFYFTAAGGNGFSNFYVDNVTILQY
jgi:hypothetical protein